MEARNVFLNGVCSLFAFVQKLANQERLFATNDQVFDSKNEWRNEKVLKLFAEKEMVNLNLFHYLFKFSQF